MNIKHKWTRRRILSMAGLSSASVALAPFLPTFEAKAQTGDKKLIVFSTTNGHWLPEWRPDGVSGNEASLRPDMLKRTTRPLEPYLDRMLMLDGLDLESTEERAMGHPSLGTMWTGATVRWNGEDSGNSNNFTWPRGPSVDQFVGARTQGAKPYAALPIGVYPGRAKCSSVSSFIGDNQPAAPEQSPRALFDRIFDGVSGGTSMPGEIDPEQLRAIQQRRNVLDVVNADLGVLRRRLARVDREQLDSHLAGVESMQARLNALERNLEPGAMNRACVVPGRPRGPLSGSTDQAPEVTRIFADLTADALRCDLTNAISFQLGNEGSAMGGRASWLGSHHAEWHNHDFTAVGDRQYIEVNEWFAQMFRYLLDSLDSAGVLDDCIVVWAATMPLGRKHTGRNAPVVLIQGRNINHFKTGTYLRFGSFERDPARGNRQRGPHGGEPMNKLLVSLCNAMGVETNQFGWDEVASGPLTRAEA